jgi:hypothetical protein
VSLRIVTPASGAPGVSISYDCGTVWQPAGVILDVPPGSPLETAIGVGNLTALTAGQQAAAISGSPPEGTSNS